MLRSVALPCGQDASKRLRAALPRRGFLQLDGRGWGHEGSLVAACPTREIAGRYTTAQWIDACRAAGVTDHCPVALHDGIDSIATLPLLPGWGGMAGYPDATGLSRIWLGFYPCVAVLSDVCARIFWIEGGESTAEAMQAALADPDCLPRARHRDMFRLDQPFRQELSEGGYQSAFSRIQEYIVAGDVYQVNFAHRFSAPCHGDPHDAHARVTGVMNAPWSGFLDTGDQCLLSYSPETFLTLDDGHVTTAPIKGTRPRADNPSHDEQLRSELEDSAKDRAENLMIVDLLRNDLGRVAATGTVRVSKLFGIETHTHVHHMVSVIEADIANGQDALTLMGACFPGGSVTGAPKRRAMEIIAELESGDRGAYCGTLFGLSVSGTLRSNLCIRTLEARDGQLSCWGGGGIVADSCVGTEYAETLHKVGRLMALFEQFCAKR